jgi:hypothetical protein
VRTGRLALEHGLASGPLQRGKLHGRILGIGGESGAVVFHAAHMRPIFVMRESLNPNRAIFVVKLISWEKKCARRCDLELPYCIFSEMIS